MDVQEPKVDQPQVPAVREQATTPQAILALAVEKGADPAVISKMMDLQERWEAKEAKKAYVRAMAAFKQEAPPVLAKDASVDFTSSKGRTHYRHTTLGSVVLQITSIMGRHGLSASWSTAQTESGGVTVTCHITHELGHSEGVTLTAPPDASGNKNLIQQVGSTVTYLQRYTLLAALGLATADQDDDGVKAGARQAENHEPAAERPRAEGVASAPNTPPRPAAAGSFTPPICPTCNSPMWDNRDRRHEAEAQIKAGTRELNAKGKPKSAPPAWKCKDKDCKGVIWESGDKPAPGLPRNHGNCRDCGENPCRCDCGPNEDAAPSALAADPLAISANQVAEIKQLCENLDWNGQALENHCFKILGKHMQSIGDGTMSAKDADKLSDSLCDLIEHPPEEPPAEFPPVDDSIPFMWLAGLGLSLLTLF